MPLYLKFTDGLFLFLEAKYEKFLCKEHSIVVMNGTDLEIRL